MAGAERQRTKLGYPRLGYLELGFPMSRRLVNAGHDGKMRRACTIPPASGRHQIPWSPRESAVVTGLRSGCSR
jgi:hypothetical protein